MRHRTGMILAAVMTRVPFFPGAWVTSGSCALSPRQASLAAAERRLQSKTQGGAGDADGLAYGRARFGFGERNGCPASGVLPMWRMFLQHRMRCVSTIRWRASLTILAGWC
jgi:hypothetical protein